MIQSLTKYDHLIISAFFIMVVIALQRIVQTDADVPAKKEINFCTGQSPQLHWLVQTSLPPPQFILNQYVPKCFIGNLFYRSLFRGPCPYDPIPLFSPRCERLLFHVPALPPLICNPNETSKKSHNRPFLGPDWVSRGLPAGVLFCYLFIWT